MPWGISSLVKKLWVDQKNILLEIYVALCSYATLFKLFGQRWELSLILYWFRSWYKPFGWMLIQVNSKTTIFSSKSWSRPDMVSSEFEKFLYLINTKQQSLQWNESSSIEIRPQKSCIKSVTDFSPTLALDKSITFLC